LTRWVLKLSEFEFEIEHKAGKKHVNADCLSRYIASIASGIRDRNPPDDKADDMLTREAVFTAQQQDPYCQEVM
jgi:hypothetical protein